ncbi:MAG: hypothetical protein JO142_17350 [Burkholderiales bacterium]|nr:hypothetical protein [Burkholderiales bacterium]
MRLPSVAWRLVLATALLLALGQSFSAALLRPLLPLYGWAIAQADDRLAVRRVDIETDKKGVFLEVEATLARPLQLDTTHWVFPDASPRLAQGVLVGTVLQPLILLLAVVLAWPARTRGEALLRGLIALPVLAALALADAPLSLAGALLDLREIAPGAAVSPLVPWNDFLQTGGRAALAVCAAALVVTLGQRLVGRRATFG